MISKNRFVDYPLLIIFILIFLFVQNGCSQNIIWLCLITFYFYFFQVIAKPVRVFKNIKTFFKIDIFFMLFYYFLFYFPYQSYVLGFSDINQNSFIKETYLGYTNISIVASTIGLISFIIGHRSINYKDTIRKKTSSTEENLSRDKAGAISKLLFWLVLILLIVFLQTGYALLFSGRYNTSDLGDNTLNGVFFLLCHFVTVAGIFSVYYYSRAKRTNVYLISTLVIAGLWGLALLIIGDRNSFFIIAISLVASFYSLVREISRIKIIGFLVVGFLVYQLIEVSRTSENRGFDAMAQALTEGAATSSSVEESSFSITTLTSRAAFSIVPAKHPFYYGKFKLIGIAGIIPYSRGFLVSPEDRTITSADALVQEILGRKATWGVGTNIISDIYLDFGIIGVIVLMFLVGWFAKYVLVKCQRDEGYISKVMYFVVFALYAETPRYAFDFPVRNIAWTLLFFWICDRVFKHKTIHDTKLYSKKVLPDLSRA